MATLLRLRPGRPSCTKQREKDHSVHAEVNQGFPLSDPVRVVTTELKDRALSESPMILKRLKVPDETKEFVRVLNNPYTGCVVYLIGTAHVSPASRDDVRMLIKAVRPDLVAVEVSWMAH